MTCSIKTALERLKVAQTTITLHDLDYPNKSYSAEAPIKLFSLFSWFIKIGIYFSLFKRDASVVFTVSCSKQGKRILKREDIWLLFKPRPFLLVYATLYNTPVLKRAHTNQKISSIGLYCMALLTYEFFSPLGFRYLSSSLRLTSLHVRYPQAEFDTSANRDWLGSGWKNEE